jgi:D-alanine-D-alanine ligase
MSSPQALPNIIVLTNYDPAWSAFDRTIADAMIALMVDGLRAEGHVVQLVTFFDSLDRLNDYDPRVWLVWNWGEEWAGQPWTEAVVAREIERRGFAYTGSPPEVLERTKSREYIKARLHAARVPTLPSRTFTDPAHAAEWMHYPAIVKGANQHSSYGITRDSVVHDARELAQQIDWMRAALNDDAFVEPFLDTREFHVAVWGNGALEALPPVEYDFSTLSDMHERLYTYEAKFDRASRVFNNIGTICPAPADQPEWATRLCAAAIGAYRAAAIRDYGRIDLRMWGDEPQVLDVNPNPDIDPLSVLPLSTRSLGLTYGQMAGRILHHAAARMPQ